MTEDGQPFTFIYRDHGGGHPKRKLTAQLFPAPLRTTPVAQSLLELAEAR